MDLKGLGVSLPAGRVEGRGRELPSRDPAGTSVTAGTAGADAVAGAAACEGSSG